MDQLRRDLKAAFERQQSGLGGTREAPARLLTRALSTTGTRSRLLPRLAGYALTLVIAGAIAVTVLLSHGFLRQKAAPPANSIEQALTAGAPAAIGGGTGPAFVWFTGVITTPPPGSGSTGGQWAGENVEVLDWTGTVRYHFQVPHSTLPQGYNEIQAISADGTRALLDDGTVLDETGAVIGRIPLLRGDGAWRNQARWMSDDSGVCAAFSNEPVAPPVAMPPKGQGTPPPQPIPPYAKPGADHSVTLKVFGLDGHVRTIATVGAGALGEPSGYMP
ncbi:MAG TPA: hypothetical protein VET65_12960, partial [Candidatus Limnocylindrales bacterium]|nr:hypothetical protein [Candidatus Limnocylindrales bacterium]